MWSWLNLNSGGVQAAAATDTLAVTMVLAFITYFSVKLAQEALKVSQRQLRAGLHPQVLITMGAISWKGKDRAASEFTISNAGEHYFRIKEAQLDYYCSSSDHTQVQPIDYGLVKYRVVTAKEVGVNLPF